MACCLGVFTFFEGHVYGCARLDSILGAVNVDSREVNIAVQGEAGDEPNDLNSNQGNRVRDTKRWCKACDRVHDLSPPAASAVNGMQHVKNPGQEARAEGPVLHML